MPDEAIGLVAGALLTMFLLRVMLRSAGVEPWTTSWRVINLLTLPIVWPLEQIGLRGPTLVGTLALSDVIATTLVVIMALYLLASRAVITSRG